MRPRLVIPFLILVLATGCPAEMWIPIQTVPRAPTTFDHVQFLDEAPTGAYEVLGIITPEPGEYDTEAEAVHAMRKVAAKHGADALFIEAKTPGAGWSFNAGMFGSKGGTKDATVFRAKAIAWTKATP